MSNKHWYWIELIGFDNTLQDYGVEQFYSKLSGEPAGFSILFSHIDFINDFDAEKGEYELLPCDCSYSGHNHGGDRSRQVWTSLQLKGLIEQLHKKNAKVIFSLFNFFEYVDDNGDLQVTNFCSKHKELVCFDQNKQVYEHSINILKRFKDGSYYEDYLFNKLKEVIDYYGFDGMQVADGISSNRPAIQKGDFSDDIVGQFAMWLKVENKPADFEQLEIKCDDSVVDYKKRREFILENLYFEFLCFQNARWKVFYEKLYKVLEPEKYLLFINSFWTRDPFEAIYRYGIDYQVAYKDGVYALMVEEVSTTVPTQSREYVGGFRNSAQKTRNAHYEFFLMQMLLKAYIPQFNQIPLLPINDNQEQWNAIHDVRNELKRAVYRRNNNVVFSDNKYVSCVEASLYCLCDGVSEDEWAFLENINNLKVLDDVKSVVGYTLYFPKRHLFKDVERYIKTKDYGFHKLACMLLSKGTQICSVVTENDISNYASPVLVLFPEYLDKDEIEMLLNARATVVFVSKEKSFGTVLVEKDIIISTNKNNIKLENEANGLLGATLKVNKCSESYEDYYGGIWTAPLKYNEWNSSYLKELSKTLNTLINCPRLVNTPNSECKITTFEKENGNYIVIISNDEYYNFNPKIEFDKKIKEVVSLTKYPGYKVNFSKNSFYVQVGQRTIEMCEVSFYD